MRLVNSQATCLRCGSATARLPYTRFGSMLLSRGLLVGNQQGTICTPPLPSRPAARAQRLCAPRSQPVAYLLADVPGGGVAPGGGCRIWRWYWHRTRRASRYATSGSRVLPTAAPNQAYGPPVYWVLSRFDAGIQWLPPMSIVLDLYLIAIYQLVIPIRIMAINGVLIVCGCYKIGIVHIHVF